MNELMIHVERAVRPVRAGGARKDRMREELFAHLRAIYEEERAKLGDDRAALDQAKTRFGDPAALTRELQTTVSGLSRVDAVFEYWCGWRGGETALRFLVRSSGLLFLFMAGVFTAMAVGLGPPTPSADRWFRYVLVMAGVFAVCASLIPLGLIYFEVRNVMWGVLGRTRSPLRAALWAGLAGVVTAAFVTSFCLLGGVDPSDSVGLAWLSLPAGVVVAGLFVALARLNGQREILHTLWESLDIAGARA